MNNDSITTTTDTAAPFLAAHQCADCLVYRVDCYFDGDLCDDCVPVDVDTQPGDDDPAYIAHLEALHVDGPTVDFHE
jgi:hypothetical protein